MGVVCIERMIVRCQHTNKQRIRQCDNIACYGSIYCRIHMLHTQEHLSAHTSVTQTPCNSRTESPKLSETSWDEITHDSVYENDFVYETDSKKIINELQIRCEKLEKKVKELNAIISQYESRFSKCTTQNI